MSDPTAAGDVIVTRIVNSCVLLETPRGTVLTDPWFTERWHLHHGEPLGLEVSDLPALDAIIVSHSFINHWDRRALRRFPGKDRTLVVAPSAAVARQAARLGFAHVEMGRWGTTLALAPPMRLEVVRAHRSPTGRVNSYILDTGGTRVFFGGEAERVEPISQHRGCHRPVDIALLPVNGLSVPGKGRIVMGPSQAVEAATVLGASVLIPIHDAHASDWPWAFIRRTGDAADAINLALSVPGAPRVVDIPTGTPWRAAA